MENWKSVKGYEGYYEVSDLGRVRRLGRFVKTGIKHSDFKLHKGHILKQAKKRRGYYSVDLCKDGKVKTISVHRLVATAFLPQGEGQTQVNHKNANKNDNRAANLEWCTPQENVDHAKTNKLYHNPKVKMVKCKQTGMVFEGSFKAAEWVNETKFGNSKQTKNIANKIRCSCNGLQTQAYGFTWCYLEGSSTIS